MLDEGGRGEHGHSSTARQQYRRTRLEATTSVELRIVEPGAFADEAARTIRDAVAGREPLCLGLPTGRTMVPVYRRLAEGGLSLPAGAVAFAIDEYCWGDPAHPGTNASFFRAHWPFCETAPVTVPWADASVPEEEIGRHCAAIAAAGGFDVVVLGIGRNGHIAFNEPGSTAEDGCRVVTLTEPTREQTAETFAEPPARGMTVGVREILAARRVILLATGGEKRDAVAAAFGETAGASAAAVPAALLRAHPGLTMLCDREAAALLR